MQLKLTTSPLLPLGSRRPLRYYDSLQGYRWKPDLEALENVKAWLHAEHLEKCNGEPFPWGRDRWEIKIFTKREIPQQSNCVDCGPFACMFMWFEAFYHPKHPNPKYKMAPSAFGSEHMPLVRRRIAYELLSQKLL